MPVDARGLSEYTPGGRFTATATTVASLIRSAYRIQGYQLVGAPGWFSTRRYDISAKADENPAPTQQTLLRALLKDQFELAVHEETREMPVFALVLARSDGRPGPKLVKSDFDCAAYRAAPHPRPRLAALCCAGPEATPARFRAKPWRFHSWRRALDFSRAGSLLTRPGWWAAMTWISAWTPDEAAGGGADGPSFFTALQEQLGLKLVAERGPVNVLVVDRAAEPEASELWE